MGDVSLTHFAFTPKDLDSLPEAERIFFVQGAGLLQEVTSLQKYARMSSHGVTDHWERAAENAQAMYFCCLLAGNLFEGWKTLHLDRYRAVLAKYRPTLDQTSLMAYERLESYFSAKENLCGRVRNKFSHHRNYGEIRNVLRNWPEDQKIDVLISDNHANCAWLMSDQLTNFALFGIECPEEGIDNFFKDVFGVARDFVEAVGSLVAKILIEAIKAAKLQGSYVVVRGAPALSDIRLHYFITGDEEPTST